MLSKKSGRKFQVINIKKFYEMLPKECKLQLACATTKKPQLEYYSYFFASINNESGFLTEPSDSISSKYELKFGISDSSAL